MNVLVLQHVAVEHPGIFREFFREDSFALHTVELDEGEAIPDLAPYDLMLVMGGPQDVWQEREHPWLVEEKSAIRKFVIDMQRPYLGICLGHQLLAAAVGGDVAPAQVSEVGVLNVSKTQDGKRDEVLKNLPDPMTVLQWHGAEVTRLPPQAVLLASSPACRVQAFRFGHRAYGFQCHVEITAQTVDDWAAIPTYACSLDAALGENAVHRLSGEVQQRLPQFNRDARALYKGFKKAALLPGGSAEARIA